MCRNIKPLFNFDPPATEEEIREASLQFVRKLSGFQKPSQINEKAFNNAVDRITLDTRKLFDALSTTSARRDRAIEAEKRKVRNEKRFGNSTH